MVEKKNQNDLLRNYEKLIKHKEYFLTQLDRLSNKLTTENGLKEIDSFLHSEDILLRIGRHIYTGRFEEFLESIDKDKATQIQEVVSKIKKRYPWLRGELYRVKREKGGLIAPPTEGHFSWSMNVPTGYPQIEETIFSGRKKAYNIKWNLDDHISTIRGKLDTCKLILSEIYEKNITVNDNLINSINSEIEEICSTGEHLLSLLKRIKEAEHENNE